MLDYGYEDEKKQQCVANSPYAPSASYDSAPGSEESELAPPAIGGRPGGPMWASPDDVSSLQQAGIASWGPRALDGDTKPSLPMTQTAAEPGGSESEAKEPGGGLGLGSVPDVIDVGMSKLGPLMSEGGAELAGGAEAAGALGMGLGPLGIATGMHEINEGTESGNAGQVFQGALGTEAGVAGTVEGVSTVVAAGLGETGAGIAAGELAVGASGVAAPLAAGALGAAVGNNMAHVADSDATKTGVWQDDSGNNESAMDWGASAGTWYDKHVGDGSPSVMGGIAAGLGGIAGGIAGTAQVGGRKLQQGWDWLTDSEP